VAAIAGSENAAIAATVSTTVVVHRTSLRTFSTLRIVYRLPSFVPQKSSTRPV